MALVACVPSSTALLLQQLTRPLSAGRERRGRSQLPAASGSLPEELGDGLLHAAAGRREGARRGRRLEAHQADHRPQLRLNPHAI